MFRLKKYDKEIYSVRFRRYKAVFLTGFGVFFLCAVLEWFFIPADKARLNENLQLLPFFLTLMTWEAFYYLFSLLFGVTIYAPFFQALSLAFRGFSAGFTLQSIAKTLGEKGSIPALLLCGIYLLISAWLFCAYASFCTLVSFRLFTDGIRWDVLGREERVFGGTLFNSTLFCNTVNLRFLFSYVMLFAAGIFLSAAFGLAYAFLFVCFV